MLQEILDLLEILYLPMISALELVKASTISKRNDKRLVK